jgi:hypothetical protein
MYKVYYYIGNSNMVSHKTFPSLAEATEFFIKRPKDSVIEIKHYDDKTNNIQDQSHNIGSD